MHPLFQMKLLDIPLGLIINFHELKLIDGVVRMILPSANRDSAEFKQKATKATKGTEASYIQSHIDLGRKRL